MGAREWRQSWGREGTRRRRARLLFSGQEWELPCSQVGPSLLNNSSPDCTNPSVKPRAEMWGRRVIASGPRVFCHCTSSGGIVHSQFSIWREGSHLGYPLIRSLVKITPRLPLQRKRPCRERTHTVDSFWKLWLCGSSQNLRFLSHCIVRAEYFSVVMM